MVVGETEAGSGGSPPRKRLRLDSWQGSAFTAFTAAAGGTSASFHGEPDVPASQEDTRQRASTSMTSNGHITAEEPAEPADVDTVGPSGLIRRTEFIRLLTQSLYGLGYGAAAKRLEVDSGILLQSETIASFRDALLGGDWKTAVALLDTIRFLDEAAHKRAKFLILQQKYLELMERRDYAAALQCLRLELAPLRTSLIMCRSADELHKKSAWLGGGSNSRRQLLAQLQELLPPSLLIPEHRLEVLVEQALSVQRKSCQFHNTTESAFSLLVDHCCGRDQVLEAHSDEVWHVQFSHNGKWLASASRDSTVILWEVNSAVDVSVKHILRGHTQPLSFVAWSPDDSHLLTCGSDKLVKLWDTAIGTCKRTYDRHKESVTACAWFPDGQRFVSGGLDKSLFFWDIDGKELDHWSGSRINDLAITADGERLVSVNHEKEIRVVRLVDKSTDSVEDASANITSLCLSKDGKSLLVNLSKQEIHLRELTDKGISQTPVLVYSGQRQGRYVIRSCFGGTDEAFVVSGSEDSQVYIWHRNNGDLLAVLGGHAGTVNAVTWNPVDPHMFASASDDKTVRIWGVASATSKSASPQLSSASNGVHAYS
eukprot:jgi/Chlat1/8402/Chrsp80S09222